MSLLREIQTAAIDSNIDVAILLRKCKVLASRLGSQEFKDWVDKELNGYADVKQLPDYRVCKVNSKGHFSGPFQSGLRNADIPMSCIPKNLREKMSHTYMVDPAASLEALSKTSEGATLQEPWNPDIVAFVGDKIYQDMNCMQAWKVIPGTLPIRAIDAIRNRILSFVLEIEAESPEAGEASASSRPVPPQRVNQIFNTYISGNVQNVATGSTDFQQIAKQSNGNDKVFTDLLDAIANAKADKNVAKKLAATVEEMRGARGTEKFKEHYHSFVSVLADHIQVLGPVVAPFLPSLAGMIS